MFNSKLNILNKISALRVLSSSGFPRLKDIRGGLLGPKNDTLNFVLELMKVLVGWETLKTETINFLTYQVAPLEHAVKLFLKSLIREHFFCNTDGIIPQSLIDDGFNVSIREVDVFGLLRNSPSGEVGSMLYSGQDDFNAFLYRVIAGQDSNWKDILVVGYLSSGIVGGQQRTDVFNVKVHPSYTGLTVNKLLNNYIDSITLITLPLLMNRIFDKMFGVISLRMGKSKEQIRREVEFEEYISKIIDLPDDIIDNSYYGFSKTDYQMMASKTEARFEGKRVLVNCNGAESILPLEVLIDTNSQLVGAELVEIKDVLSNRFEVMGESANSNVKQMDRHVGLLEFYYEFIKSIITGVVYLVFSPKVVLFLLLYFKIGNIANGFKDFKDFLLKNRDFMETLVKKTLLPFLIDYLVQIIIKEVKRLVAKDFLERKTEQLKYYKLVLTSL